MSAINQQTEVSAPADRFPSLVALLDAHADLLQRHQSDGSSPTILAEIDHFIARARATGALLDARTDRRAAQVLLDYWIATLAGLGAEPPTGILDPFDPSLAPDLPDALCPYVGLNAFHEDDRNRRSSGSVATLNFSPDARRLVAVTTTGKAGVWDARTGRELHPLLGHTGAVFWATYSPNGKWIATSSADTTARIWNANTGQLVHILAGHTGAVYWVYFNPDNQQVLTTSVDHTARIWSTVSGTQLAVLDQQHGPVASASFNARTTAVVTASFDGLARIYPIPPCDICRPGAQLVTLADQWVTRDLTPRERAAYTQ